MDFDRVFQDLEGRFDHLESEDMRAVSDELARAERAQVTVADRLRASEGSRLVLQLRGGTGVEGRLVEVGRDWLRLESLEGVGGAVVPLSRIAVLEGLAPRARPASTSPVSAPRGLGHVLRQLGRDRVLVKVHTDAGAVHGRLRGVGADSLELRISPTGESTLPARGVDLVVAFAGIVLVQLL